MRVIEDGELREYAERIGRDEYRRQYRLLYEQASKYPNKRWGGKRKRTIDLDKIREKYRNGVTPEILDEWRKDLVSGFREDVE